jgi:ketosteroid isomerase-like protein
MTDALTLWIENYRRAWESNDPAHILALFTEDAEYRTEPYSVPWSGHAQILEGWLEAQDEPGEATFEWSPLVSTAELGIAQGETVYRDRGLTYSNMWVIRFAPDGRASSFTEWWMDQDAD